MASVFEFFHRVLSGGYNEDWWRVVGQRVSQLIEQGKTREQIKEWAVERFDFNPDAVLELFDRKLPTIMWRARLNNFGRPPLYPY